MGCDIHGWVEKRVGEKWVAVKELVDDTRNYQRFAKLAGVRGEGPPALGLPDDVSDTAGLAAKEYGTDGHSHTYMDLYDAFEIFRDTSGTLGIMAREGYDAYEAFGIGDINDGEYRLVFWFDN